MEGGGDGDDGRLVGEKRSRPGEPILLGSVAAALCVPACLCVCVCEWWWQLSKKLLRRRAACCAVMSPLL